MEQNNLIWSCNRRKFLKVLAADKIYKERLGWKCNSVWYLLISVTKDSQLTPTRQTYYTDWEFELVREHCLEESLEVNARLLLGIQVMIDKVLYYDSNVKSYTVGHCMATHLDYRLDLILNFPQTSERIIIPKELFLISKTENLSTDFQQMFKNEHLADVTLKCDAIVLKAHKCVLSSRSSVFATMFSSLMQERETDTVVITDLSSEVLRAVINFLYCGKVTIDSTSIVYDLLYAAEKYQIKALKEGCVTYLKPMLSCENAIEILKIADLYDKQLKSDAMFFIKEHLSDLEDTGEFLQLKLENPVLALEVYAFKG